MEDESIHLFREYILTGEYALLFEKELVENIFGDIRKQKDSTGKKNGGTKLLSVFDKVTHSAPTQKKQEIMYLIYEQ